MNNISILISGLKVIFIFSLILSLVPIMVWMERKGAAYIQDRRGPNRASILGIRLGGLIHSLADAIKLFTKEELIAGPSNRLLFYLAPIIAFFVATAIMAVIPFTQELTINGYKFCLQIANLEAGLVYVFALSALGVFAILTAGWAAYGKYSLLGALRAASQLISYELALGLAVLSIFLLAGSLNLQDIILDQGHNVWRWNIVRQPLAFIIFLAALFAETNRLPFDLVEAESELVSGYHTEYSSMKFALFFIAEYAHIIIGSLIIAALFLGGWQIPFVSSDVLFELNFLNNLPAWVTPISIALIQMGVMLAKAFMFCSFFIWVRWTLPRFRYDQLMRLGWKTMIPLSIVNTLITSAIIVFS